MANDTLDNPHTHPSDRPEIYELRVSGRLGREASAWFADMSLQIDDSTSQVQTIIRGAVSDEAALYGLISRIRDLGLTLLSVNRIEERQQDGDDAMPKGRHP